MQNWFILLPELCMIGFFVVAFLVNIFREEKTSKTFFTLAQFFLAASAAFMLLFYNRSAYPDLWQNTSFTTLFKIFAYLLAMAWFYLSSKWFLNKKRTSFRFCVLSFALLLGLSLLASSVSLLFTSAVVPAVCFLTYLLAKQHWDPERMLLPARHYAAMSAFFCLLLWGGTALLYLKSGSFSYAAVKDFLLGARPADYTIIAAALMITACFFFLPALVPFHLGFVNLMGGAVLPVSGFLTLVPPLVYLCALINLIRGCLLPLSGLLLPLLSAFACVSVLLAALSASREQNIRRLTAFMTIYCLAFALLALQNLSNNALTAFFAYLVIAFLSFAGICTVFLGLKSRGDYLSELSDIQGFYQVRPYTTAAFVIFMFSLIGIAPTLGFFGYLSVFNILIENNNWGIISLMLLSLLLAAAAGLKVVKTLCFEPLNVKIDRTDKTIYICLFANVVVILIALINPAWLLRDALVILGGLN